MPLARVVVTKEVPYRDRVERFSNGYRFNLPAVTETVIHDLAAALIAIERPLHRATVKFVYANGGRDEKGAVAAYVEEFATPLVGTGSGNDVLHPESTIMYEAKRRQRVYARKFFHVEIASIAAGRPENLDPTWRTAHMNALSGLTDGTLPGGARYAWPDGTNVASAFTLDPFIRTRQFDRRGKRPPRVPLPAG